MRSQENLKDSLATTIMDGQNHMQETLKNMQLNDPPYPPHSQTQNTLTSPTRQPSSPKTAIVTQIKTPLNPSHHSTLTTLPIPNPNHPPLSPLLIPISHPSGYSNIPITYQPYPILTHIQPNPTPYHTLPHDQIYFDLFGSLYPAYGRPKPNPSEHWKLK